MLAMKHIFWSLGVVLFLFALHFVFMPSFTAATVYARTESELERQIIALTNQLNSLLAQLSPDEKDFIFKKDLFVGLKNNSDVRRLQKVLFLLGLFQESFITGNFGPITKVAVENYQSLRGIPRTGYVGPKTRAALNREEVKNYRIDPRPSYDFDAIARKISDAINVERRKYGLKDLVWDDRIAQVARLHSEDQAQDNIELTDPNLLCVYPLIRHESWKNGFRVGDRLKAAGIFFRFAGENIIAFSAATNILYRSPTLENVACHKLTDFEPSFGTLEERRTLFEAALRERLNYIKESPAAVWINKQWLSPDEIVSRAVAGWMDSLEHRENILNSAFTSSGIGIASVNEFLIITHVFKGD
jgi:uncharacterized protein YkwD